MSDLKFLLIALAMIVLPLAIIFGLCWVISRELHEDNK